MVFNDDMYAEALSVCRMAWVGVKELAKVIEGEVEVESTETGACGYSGVTEWVSTGIVTVDCVMVVKVTEGVLDEKCMVAYVLEDVRRRYCTMLMVLQELPGEKVLTALFTIVGPALAPEGPTDLWNRARLKSGRPVLKEGDRANIDVQTNGFTRIPSEGKTA